MAPASWASDEGAGFRSGGDGDDQVGALARELGRAEHRGEILEEALIDAQHSLALLADALRSWEILMDRSTSHEYIGPVWALVELRDRLVGVSLGEAGPGWLRDFSTAELRDRLRSLD